MNLPAAEQKGKKADKVGASTQMLPSHMLTKEQKEWLANAHEEEVDLEATTDDNGTDYKKSLELTYYDAIQASPAVRGLMAQSPDFAFVVKSIGVAFESAEAVDQEMFSGYYQNMQAQYGEIKKSLGIISDASSNLNTRANHFAKSIQAVALPGRLIASQTAVPGDVDPGLFKSAFAEMAVRGLVDDLALIEYESQGSVDPSIAKSVMAFINAK